MKIAQSKNDSGRHDLLIESDGRWYRLDRSRVGDLPVRGARSLIQFLAEGNLMEPDWLEPLEDPPTPDRLAPPVTSPEKVICIGKNYADHARELGGEPPELPVVFSKFSSTIIGTESPVVLPSISNAVDYEAELCVVIGRSGKHIARDQAMQHVFGYTIANDISARDWQKGKPGGQWLLGKSFDTFCPLGPWIVTADEIGDPHALDIELKLNGQVMQQANTSQMIFPVDFLVSHLSQFFRLRPGDLILTGTPAGVGAGRTPPVYLKPGDRTEVAIAKIGTLNNPVVAENC